MPHKIAPDPEHVPWCRAELETWQSFQQTLQLPRASAYRPWKSWKLLDKHDDKTLLVTAAPVPTGPHWWHVAARNCQGSKLLPRIQTLIFYWRRQYTYTKVWLSTEVKIHTVVFRIMTICILVCEHQIFWKNQRTVLHWTWNQNFPPKRSHTFSILQRVTQEGRPQ